MPARDLRGRFARVHGKGSFASNVGTLAAQAAGPWRGKVEVNQVYAHNQHEHPEYNHPDGGEAFYLRNPLFNDIPIMFKMVAAKVLTEDGCDLDDGLMDAMEHLSLQVYARAPWEFADLRASGHPQVWRMGKRIKNRPPNCHRLSPEELRTKKQLSRLLWPDRYKQVGAP